MQKSEPGLANLVEVCPASTLKLRGKVPSYKGRSKRHREARQLILDELGAEIRVPDRLNVVAVEDAEGDALDSIVAALATSRALVDQPDREALKEDYLLEGRVYV